MADQYATPDIILLKCREQLIESGPVNPDLILIATDPNSKPPMPADVWYNMTLSPMGRGDLPAMDGGGNMQTTVPTRLIVTVHSANVVDDPERVRMFLTNGGENLFILARKVLKAFNMFSPSSDSNDFPYLTNEPMRFSEYSWNKEKQLGSIQIAFDFEWDWYLL